MLIEQIIIKGNTSFWSTVDAVTSKVAVFESCQIAYGMQKFYFPDTELTVLINAVEEGAILHIWREGKLGFYGVMCHDVAATDFLITHVRKQAGELKAEVRSPVLSNWIYLQPLITREWTANEIQLVTEGTFYIYNAILMARNNQEFNSDSR